MQPNQKNDPWEEVKDDRNIDAADASVEHAADLGAEGALRELQLAPFALSGGLDLHTLRDRVLVVLGVDVDL